MTTWHSVTPTLSAVRHQTIHPSPNEATVTTPDNDESRTSALLDPQTTTAPMPTPWQTCRGCQAIASCPKPIG